MKYHKQNLIFYIQHVSIELCPCNLQGSALSVITYLLITVVVSIIIITTSIVASTIILIIITALKPKDCAKTDSQGSECQDVVDHSGNVAADSDSMEGPGSVPLLSRSRVTQRISL